MSTECKHRSITGKSIATCELCGVEIVGNGCGPGWITIQEINDSTNGWEIRSGEAWWFGNPGNGSSVG